jgi:hypothetical protein
MAAMIHLDLQPTETTLRKLCVVAEALYDSADLLYLRCANIEWDGASKDDFLHQLHRCTSAIKTLSDTLDLLGFQAAQEADLWVEVSSTFSG